MKKSSECGLCDGFIYFLSPMSQGEQGSRQDKAAVVAATEALTLNVWKLIIVFVDLMMIIVMTERKKEDCMEKESCL